MKSQDKFFRKELVTELRNIAKMMKNEPSLEKKLYYYSAAHGITSRTFRYSFSKDVLLADFVLQTSYNMLLERVERMKSGDSILKIEEAHINKLVDSLKILADKLENEENIQEPIENILSIAYISSGPGNYLKEKGMMKI